MQTIITVLRDPAMTTLIALVGIPISIWIARQQSKTALPPVHHHIQIARPYSRHRRRHRNRRNEKQAT